MQPCSSSHSVAKLMARGAGVDVTAGVVPWDEFNSIVYECFGLNEKGK
jgi:hypothetical protein